MTRSFSWIPDQVPLRLPSRQLCGVRQYYTIKSVSTAIVSQNVTTLVLSSELQLILPENVYNMDETGVMLSMLCRRSGH
jgi:hypothetical protein